MHVKQWMRRSALGVASLAVVGLAMGPGQAQAAAITWNLHTGGTCAPVACNAFGNARTFTSGGITARATAWSLTGGSGNSTLETAFLGQYGAGLGVSAREGDSDIGDPAEQHTTDNVGRYDLVLFEFSSPVLFDRAFLSAFNVFDGDGVIGDTDATYYVGTAPSPINLAGKTLGDLASSFGRVDSFTTSDNDRWLDLGSPAESGNVLLIAAYVGVADGDTDTGKNDTDTDGYDGFKITRIEGDRYNGGGGTAQVPAPGGLALLGLGLAAASLWRRWMT